MSEIFEGTVYDLSSEGTGVLNHPDGRVFFVTGTWPGDVVQVRSIKSKKRFGFAKLLKLVEPSTDRQAPPCPHQGHEEGLCGGCPWMIASYQSQLRFKQSHIFQRLQHFGLVQENSSVLNKIWPSPKTLGYRNRVQLKTDGHQIGFVSKGTHTLAPIKDCLVLTPKNRKTLKSLLQKLPNSSWTPERDKQWTFLEFNEDTSPEKVHPNQHRTFRQANTEQNLRIQHWIKETLQNEDKNNAIHELFCGSGNYTEILINMGFQKVLGVEGNFEAVQELKSHHLSNVKALHLNIFQPSTWKTIQQASPSPQILVLDPPREGFSHVLEYSEMFPSLKSIIYISCHVESFARDVKSLTSLGWSLLEVQPVDQFPQTPHIEVLGTLKKKGHDK